MSLDLTGSSLESLDAFPLNIQVLELDEQIKFVFLPTLVSSYGYAFIRFRTMVLPLYFNKFLSLLTILVFYTPYLLFLAFC